MRELEKRWDSRAYDRDHAFVWRYGESLLELLEIEPGETVLDLGCGTGHLTAKIAALGARARGMDASIDMIRKARENYPDLDFTIEDARIFTLAEPVNAVFSNAVLHWIPEADKAIERIYQALKPGGRFVAEFGGKGNIEAVITTTREVLKEMGHHTPAYPCYFPSIGDYSRRLEAAGFEVNYALLFDRPTPLENGDRGLEDWLRMFVSVWLDSLGEKEKETAIETIKTRLEPKLWRGGCWYVDYRRLRVVARKTG